MNIIYHHHSPYIIKNNHVYIMSIHGVFLNHVFREHKLVYLALFQNKVTANDYLFDFKLDEKFEIISLGLDSNLIYKYLKLPKVVFKLRSKKPDLIIFRAPTPMIIAAPFLGKSCKKIAIIVGDYFKSSVGFHGNLLKKMAIISWAFFYEISQKIILKNFNLILPNNILHYEKFKKINPKCFPIKTTIVSNEYIFQKKVNFNKEALTVLYVGRIDLDKGLAEIINSIDLIENQTGKKVKLNIVGWDVSEGETNKKELVNLITKKELSEKVVFSGKIKHGIKLMEQYRESDIFFIGSKTSEGFPRVLWEAMLSSTPIITTSVGGIGRELSPEEVYFINKVNPVNISEVVKQILDNPKKTQIKVEKALEKAKQSTIEYQSSIIRNYINQIVVSK